MEIIRESENSIIFKRTGWVGHGKRKLNKESESSEPKDTKKNQGDKPDWTCFQCEYVCPGSEMFCPVCKNTRYHTEKLEKMFAEEFAQREKLEDPTGEGWQTICSEEAQPKKVGSGRYPGGWTCVYCNTENRCRTVRCEGCDATKVSAQVEALSDRIRHNLLPTPRPTPRPTPQPQPVIPPQPSRPTQPTQRTHEPSTTHRGRESDRPRQQEIRVEEKLCAGLTQEQIHANVERMLRNGTASISLPKIPMTGSWECINCESINDYPIRICDFCRYTKAASERFAAMEDEREEQEARAYAQGRDDEDYGGGARPKVTARKTGRTYVSSPKKNCQKVVINLNDCPGKKKKDDDALRTGDSEGMWKCANCGCAVSNSRDFCHVCYNARLLTERWLEAHPDQPIHPSLNTDNSEKNHFGEATTESEMADGPDDELKMMTIEEARERIKKLEGLQDKGPDSVGAASVLNTKKPCQRSPSPKKKEPKIEVISLSGPFKGTQKGKEEESQEKWTCANCENDVPSSKFLCPVCNNSRYLTEKWLKYHGFDRVPLNATKTGENPPNKLGADNTVHRPQGFMEEIQKREEEFQESPGLYRACGPNLLAKKSEKSPPRAAKKKGNCKNQEDSDAVAFYSKGCMQEIKKKGEDVHPKRCIPRPAAKKLDTTEQRAGGTSKMERKPHEMPCGPKAKGRLVIGPDGHVRKYEDEKDVPIEKAPHGSSTCANCNMKVPKPQVICQACNDSRHLTENFLKLYGKDTSSPAARVGEDDDDKDFEIYDKYYLESLKDQNKLPCVQPDSESAQASGGIWKQSEPMWTCSLCFTINLCTQSACGGCTQARGISETGRAGPEKERGKTACGQRSANKQVARGVKEPCHGAKGLKQPAPAGPSEWLDFDDEASEESFEAKANGHLTSKRGDFVNTGLRSTCEGGKQVDKVDEEIKYLCIRTGGDSDISAKKQNEVAIKAVIQEINQQCETNKTKFVDHQFPPDSTSIAKGSSPLICSRDVWSRPDDIVVEPEDDQCEWTVCSSPKWNDFSQGELGDCWLIAGISLIADKKDLLDRVIVSKSYNKHGVYGLQLCLDGEWVGVIVDDFFPCDSEGRLKFATSKRKQLVVHLIEKAVAKLFGGYSALDRGGIANGLQLLTGYPIHATCFDQRDMTPLEKSGLHLAIKDALKKGYPIGVATENTGENLKAFTSLGLMPSHGYTVEDAHTVMGSDLLLLRDVTGSSGYKGQWSNLSKEWEQVLPELRPSRGIGDAEAGIFWISKDHFLELFTEVDVCRVQAGWFDHRLAAHLPRKSEREYENFRLEVSEKTAIQIYMQQEHGNLKTTSEGTVLQIHDKDYNFIDSTEYTSCSEITWFKESLPPGQYYIFIFSHSAWQHDKVAKVNLVCQSEKEITLCQETYEPCVIADVLTRMVMARGTAKVSRGGECLTIYSLLPPLWRGMIFVAENENKDSSFAICTAKPKGDDLLSTRMGSPVDIIQPGHRQVLQITTMMSPGAAQMDISMPVWRRQSPSMEKILCNLEPLPPLLQVIHKQIPNCSK